VGAVITTTSALFAWLISHQPTVLFSHNEPATSNQPTVPFSQNKPAPAISHQPTEQAADLENQIPAQRMAQIKQESTPISTDETQVNMLEEYLGPLSGFW
jgi:hypothetical protein